MTTKLVYTIDKSFKTLLFSGTGQRNGRRRHSPDEKQPFSLMIDSNQNQDNLSQQAHQSQPMNTPMQTGKNYVCCIGSDKLEIWTNFQIKLYIQQIKVAQGKKTFLNNFCGLFWSIYS